MRRIRRRGSCRDYLLFSTEGRVETGVEEGDAISPFYDPMIAKLVATGEDRADAITSLREMAAGVEVWPVRTNAGFIYRAMMDPDFQAGMIDTGFIAQRGDALIPDDEPSDLEWSTAASFALDKAREADEGLGGFRLNASKRFTVSLGHNGVRRTLADDSLIADATGYTTDESVLVFHRGSAFTFDLASRGTAVGAAADGAILAPMPGRIIAVEVAAGERVAKGQKLVTLEAMKMEHTLTAPFDGTVAELNATAGAQVTEGATLVRVERGE
jgi:3-methylcrotonyl-CoA carboxylase alpha subunit